MRIILDLFAPLQIALRGPDEMALFLRELGWELEFNETQIGALQTLLDIQSELSVIAHAGQSLTGELDGETVEEIILAAEAVFAKINALSALDPAALDDLPAPLHDPDDMAQMAPRLPEVLLVRWLDSYGEQVAEMLRLFGVIGGVIGEEKVGDLSRPTIVWEALGPLLTDPIGQLKSTYDWGGEFRHADLMTRLVGLMVSFGILPRRGPVHDDIVAGWGGVSNAAGAFQIEAPLLRYADPRGRFSFMTDLVLAPASEGGKLAGLQLTNVTEGTMQEGLDLGNGWSLGLTASGDLNNMLALKALPSGPQFDLDVSGA